MVSFVFSVTADILPFAPACPAIHQPSLHCSESQGPSRWLWKSEESEILLNFNSKDLSRPHSLSWSSTWGVKTQPLMEKEATWQTQIGCFPNKEDGNFRGSSLTSPLSLCRQQQSWPSWLDRQSSQRRSAGRSRACSRSLSTLGNCQLRTWAKLLVLSSSKSSYFSIAALQKNV